MAKKIFNNDMLGLIKQNQENLKTAAPENPVGQERRVQTDPFNQPKARNKVSVKNQRPIRVQLWLDEETKEMLDLVKFRNKLENQDLMYAAIRRFAEEYISDAGLSEDGKTEVRRLLEKN